MTWRDGDRRSPVPASTGRKSNELPRAIDSLQLTAKHRVSTPVNWKQGEDVIIVPSLSDE